MRAEENSLAASLHGFGLDGTGLAAIFTPLFFAASRFLRFQPLRRTHIDFALHPCRPRLNIALDARALAIDPSLFEGHLVLFLGFRESLFTQLPYKDPGLFLFGGEAGQGSRHVLR
jgi:hypothetical protein